MQHLLRIGVVAIGNGEINLTVQMIRVVNEENFIAVDVVLRKTGYRRIRMQIGLDTSTR